MATEKLKSRGRLVPTQPTGVQYQVEYVIKITTEVRQHGRSSTTTTRTRWAKCSVKSPSAHMIPDGTYFLHSEDGRVLQLKSTGGQWQFLDAQI
jgi:hypothetical protein